MHRKTSQRLISGLLLLSGVLLAACEKSAQQYDYSIFAFGTLIDVTLYDTDKKQAEIAFEQLQKNFDRYHQHWSPWTNGDLAKLNTKLSEQTTTHKSIDLPEHLVPLITR